MLFNHSHFQTIWPNYFRKKPAILLTSRRVTLPDGDFLDINCIDNRFDRNGDLDVASQNDLKNIVLIFHGLGGSIRSHSSLTLMHAMKNARLQPVFVHFRGASAEPNKKTISYHAGKTDDIAYVIEKIHQEYPDKNLFAIGISIGGSALLNYLGKYQIDNPLTGAVAISVPYDLYDAALTLNRGFAKAYQHHLLKSQKLTLSKKFQTMDCPIDLNKALNANTFYEFDDAVTAPLHGFNNAMDYYNQCSAKQYLINIKTPTLLIHAKDDPFMSKKSIPELRELSKNVELELHEKGGHVGFIEGRWPWRFEYYLERRIPEYFRSLKNEV